MYYTNFESPIGNMTLASDGEALIGLWNENQKYHGNSIYEKEEFIYKDDLEIFSATKNWLKDYFDGNRPDISKLNLKPNGTEFRHIVWSILCDIPYGEVVTYNEIARRTASIMGRETMSSQAIGGAVGHNPISVIIPCHRVVGSSGSLTGYAGGLKSKIFLLELEGVNMNSLYLPTKGTAL